MNKLKMEFLTLISGSGLVNPPTYTQWLEMTLEKCRANTKEQSAIPQRLKDAIALMLRYADRCFDGAEYDKFIECLRVVEQRASV